MSYILVILFLSISVTNVLTIDQQTYRFLSKESINKGRENLFQSVNFSQEFINELPDSFDSREKWFILKLFIKIQNADQQFLNRSNCPSIGDIYDQSACGDCWAISTVTAATDRMCISTGEGGSSQPRLSVQHMVGCCKNCGYGCADGFPNYAWKWLAGGFGSPYGLVTGGQYGVILKSKDWCSNYSLKPCNHYNTPNYPLPSCEQGPPSQTPKCPSKCDDDTNYKIPFEQDIRKFKKSYAVPQNEDQIRAEIFQNGPVTAGFNVYKSWTSYRSGVYKLKGPEEELGAHAVKIIGWGIENNEKYWLISNSFGSEWGDQGYFKMLRGVGECAIEQNVVAGQY